MMASSLDRLIILVSNQDIIDVIPIHTLSKISDLVYSASVMKVFLKHHITILWGILFLCAGQVGAQDAVPTPELKVVMVLKPDSELAAKIDVLKGHLADLPVEFIVITPEIIPHDYPELYDYFRTLALEYKAKIVFLAQFDDENDANLYVTLPDTGTTLVRHLTLAKEESPEGRYEFVAVIVRGIVTAMTNGGEIGIHISDVPKPVEEADTDANASQTPVKPTKTESPSCPERETGSDATLSMFTLRVGYGAGIASEKYPLVHNFNIALFGRFNLVSVFVGYRVVMPIVSRNTNFDMSIFFHPIWAGIGVRIPLGEFELQFNLAPVVNIVTWDIASASESIAKRDDRKEVWFALSPTIIVDWNFSHQASLYLAVSLDVYLKYSSFAVLSVERLKKATFLELWRTSPLIQIGLQFGFGY